MDLRLDGAKLKRFDVTQGAGAPEVDNVASRLSFFLWSSIPDDELLKLADQGKLKDPAVNGGAGPPHARRPSGGCAGE